MWNSFNWTSWSWKEDSCYNNKQKIAHAHFWSELLWPDWGVSGCNRSKTEEYIPKRSVNIYYAAQLISNQCLNHIGWCVGHWTGQCVENESMDRRITETMSHWINESTNQTVNESVHQWIKESTNQWVNKSLNQWINGSMDQWINELVSQWVIESLSQWINESVNHAINQSINQTDSQSVSQSINHSIFINQSVSEPIDSQSVCLVCLSDCLSVCLSVSQ